MDGKIRVATLNLWCRHGDWAKRRSVLRECFRALQADLVMLQETVVDGNGDQVREVFGDDCHVIHQGRRTADGVGCSLVSRWQPTRVDELDLLVTERVEARDFPGRSTAAEFATELGPVLFVNHKPNWQVGYERERELQALEVARWIERLVGEREDLHVVLGGDFDARPESASVRFLTGRQSLGDVSVNYQDVWEFARPGESGHTFTLENPLIVVEADWARIPPRRIDYLMVRCDDRGPTLRIHSANRFADQPIEGVFATDHFGVTADLGPVD